MPIASARPSLARAGLFAGLAAGGLLVLVFLLLLLRGSASGPERVAKLTVTNPTPYKVNVEVAAPGEDLWLDLGAVDREGARTVEELPDVDDRWVFRFSSAGVDGGRLEVARTELRDAGWRLTVPAVVAERLGAAGLTPSAS